MKSDGRYATSGLAEAQFEPGSRGRVLRNLLGIKRKREMDQVEAREQLRALNELIAVYDERHRFTAADVRRIHTIWLGRVYTWAGRYRRVNVSKGRFPFAAIHTELMLIHPFRDGNGRVGRMLAILMALQAGLPPLNFGTIRGGKRQEYFAAVRAGLERNYKPMERIFSAVIRRTLEISQARRL